jgi:hypothetical protein
MLKIGFVDHHLNNYHANKFLSLLHGELAAMEARVVTAWESDPTGEDWCQKNKIPRANSAIAVAEHVDAVMVLAPDNIDAHLELCKQVFPARKPCLVDKFLATTVKDANAILVLAKQHGVKLFSSSSLRFAVELEAAKAKTGDAPRDETFARGMGDWDGYGVHTIALVIGAQGHDVKRVINTGTAKSAMVTLDYGGGKRASIEVRASADQWEAFPWTFGYRTGDKYTIEQIKNFDGFYANLMRQSVEFFKRGKSPISVEEMLKVVAILEVAGKSREGGGTWIDV